MQLDIISKEIIKPSSPTPLQLKTHKLSLLDQLAPDIYTSFLLFYDDPPRVDDKTSTSTNNNYQRLKSSLSKTLTLYYPFAGKLLQDCYVVDCDDSGIPLAETRVASSNSMSEVLKNPEMNTLQQLLPFNPNKKYLSNNDVNLAIQINRFDGGGVVIGLNFRHIVADAAASIGFIKNWVKLNSSDDNSIINYKDVVVDCTDTFPRNKAIPSYARRINEWQRVPECVTKRFVFDGSKVAALKRRDNEKRNQLEFESISSEKETPFTFAMSHSNTAAPLDTCDGNGVEAWVGLPLNDIPKFEQDPSILTYASFIPSYRSRI